MEPGLSGITEATAELDERMERNEKLKFAAYAAGALTAGAAFIGFFVWLGSWMNDNWGIYAVLPQVGLMLLAVWGLRAEQRRKAEERRRRGVRMELPEIDGLHHQRFETSVRDLMLRDGFKAKRIGGAGDDVCDVRGVDADGRIWVVQCKHRRDGWEGKATGVEVLQQLNGTAVPVYGAHVAVVVTNGRFSRPALEWGAAYGVHLVDRGRLERWAAEGRPLWSVLEGIRAPRRLPGQRCRAQHGRAAAWARLQRRRRTWWPYGFPSR
ncbi:restriction endonuclease [Streptomyces sp. NPDC001889]